MTGRTAVGVAQEPVGCSACTDTLMSGSGAVPRLLSARPPVCSTQSNRQADQTGWIDPLVVTDHTNDNPT